MTTIIEASESVPRQFITQVSPHTLIQNAFEQQLCMCFVSLHLSNRFGQETDFNEPDMNIKMHIEAVGVFGVYTSPRTGRSSKFSHVY